MRRLFLLGAALLLPRAACAQAPGPAQIGIMPNTPNVLHVLDSTKTWVPIGTVDPIAHQFSGLGVFATHAALTAGALGQIQTIKQLGYYVTGDGGAVDYDWNSASTLTPDGIFTLLPAGQSAATPGRYQLRIPGRGVHPEMAGAHCDQGVGAIVGHDDTAALNALSTALSNAGGGSIVQTVKATGCLVNSANFNVAQSVTLEGAGWNMMNGTPWYPYIVLNPAYSIVLNAYSAIRDALVWRAGLNAQPIVNKDVATFQNVTTQDGSVAINASKKADQIARVIAIGFNKCLYSNGAARLYVHTFWGDCANIIEVTQNGDVSRIDDVHTNQYWTGNFNNHLNIWQVGIAGGGSGYNVGDTLSLDAAGGNYVVAATFTVTSVSGGAITGLTILDPGDYNSSKGASGISGSPQTVGVAMPTTVYAGGNTGTNGTGDVTIAAGCAAAGGVDPQINITVSGGAMTAVNGIDNPGQCDRSSTPPLVSAVVPPPSGPLSGLTGAWLQISGAKNPLATRAVTGSGSGATVTISVQMSGYRNGVGLNIHDKVDGLVVTNAEFEGQQISARLADLFNDHIFSIGGEGNKFNTDHQTIGVELDGCVKNTVVSAVEMDSHWIDFYLNNNSNATDGTCVADTVTSPIIFAPQVGINSGISRHGIQTTAGSSGTIIGPVIAFGQSPLESSIYIGPGSGLWQFSQIQYQNGNSSSNINNLIAVAPTGTPPTSDQYGWTGRGSLIINGDMDVDQVGEGAIVANPIEPKIDRWRVTCNVTGSNFTTQRTNNSPNGFGHSLQVTVGAAQTPTGTQGCSIGTQIENPNIEMLQWGTGIIPIPVVLEWWFKSSLAGNFNLSVVGPSHGYSYVHSFPYPTANAWVSYQTVVPGPVVGAWNANAGIMQTLISFDLGSGPGAQTSTPDTWVPGWFREKVGDTQLITTAAATMQISGVHLKPGPWQSNYQFPDYGTELAKAQRFYQKSYPGGWPAGSWALAAATPNAAGSGYGATLTGTMTWNGTGCSTNPVLNVTTTAAGAISAVNSIPTAGYCTTLPSNTATTWTPGGGLSAGSGATFTMAFSANPGATAINAPPALTSSLAPVRFPVSMAAPPTVTIYNSARANNNCLDFTNGADVGAGAALNSGASGFTLQCPLNAGSPASGDQIQAHWVADTGL